MLKFSGGRVIPDSVIDESKDVGEQVGQEAERSLVMYYMRYRAKDKANTYEQRGQAKDNSQPHSKTQVPEKRCPCVIL